MVKNESQEMSVSSQQKQSGRWMLILLVLFFSVPIGIVVLMHKYQLHPTGASNGELIQPAVALQLPAELLDSEQKKVNNAVWNSKWNMVYLAQDCDARCEAGLYEARQIHVSLAKEIERVQRILITENANTVELKKRYPDLIIINQPKEAVAKLSQQFLAKDKTKQAGLYLVDPLGNLMMHYNADTKAKAIRADVLKLLKYSWAG